MKKVNISLKGILGGFIALIISIVLLWWNEGNAVKNIRTTAEMEKMCVDIKSDSIDSKNDGKLVATHGEITNEEELLDNEFGVKIKTPIMKRIVELYQWTEESSTDSDDYTTYSYNKEWSSELIDSERFHQSGHENPQQKIYDDLIFTSNDVKVGAFTLDSYQVKKLSTKASFSEFNPDIISKLNLSVYDNYLTTSSDLSNPQIGDTRISFVYNDSTEVSILAVQKGNTFVDFVSSTGKHINKIVDGNHTSSEMINIIKNENNIMKWIFRISGIIICVIAVGSILKPICRITSYIPILGGLINSAVGLISVILGLCISLMVIAIAWIRFRPLIGIGLLIIIGALIFLIVKKGKKNQKNEDDSSFPQQTINQSEPTNNMPANDIQTNNVSTNNMPGNNGQSNNITMNNMPINNIQENNTENQNINNQ